MLNFIIYGTLLVHGLIHFIGFGEAFQLLPTPQFTRNVSKGAGISWLTVGFLFLMVLVMGFLQFNGWWFALITTVALSQILIVIYWHDAKFGTIPNVLLTVMFLIFGMG
jgi:hypothetical protein